MGIRIGGIVPFTLQDYPAKVATMIFTQGCNFMCSYCHNKALIPKLSETTIPTSTVMEFLLKRRSKITGVVVSGGEPTCQEGLGEFLREIKGLGYSVKLDTNGSNPRVLKRLLNQGLVDYVAMDIKAPWDRYEMVTGTPGSGHLVRKSMEIVSQSSIEHVFRTTVVPGVINEEAIRIIKATIPPGSHHVLQPFKAS